MRRTVLILAVVLLFLPACFTSRCTSIPSAFLPRRGALVFRRRAVRSAAPAARRISAAGRTWIT